MEKWYVQTYKSHVCHLNTNKIISLKIVSSIFRSVENDFRNIYTNIIFLVKIKILSSTDFDSKRFSKLKFTHPLQLSSLWNCKQWVILLQVMKKTDVYPVCVCVWSNTVKHKLTANQIVRSFNMVLLAGINISNWYIIKVY